MGKQPQESPLDLGPATSVAEREPSLNELLSGLTAAGRLPLVDTDATATYDSELYANLTTDTRPRPKVEVQMGAATLLSGALDQSRVNRVMAAMRSGFRACYQRGLTDHDDAPLSAKLTLVLQIASSGEVVSAKVAGKQHPALASVYDCMRTRATRALFEPGPGKSSSLSVVIDFTSQGWNN